MPSLFDPDSDRNGAAEGEARRDKALAILRARRAALVRELQAAALRVGLERGEVCADDCRAVVPIPAGISPKVVGAAFRELADAGFLRRTGFRTSVRPIAHARAVSVWKVVDADGATAWLALHPSECSSCS